MPAPVTHIVLALSILPMLPDKNKEEFLIGTSFPDIRYLGTLTREQTHMSDPTWSSIIKESSSFKAGIEFHALVDRIHDEYMSKHNAYNYIAAPDRLKSYILKFYEDMLLYEYCTIWPEIINSFDIIVQDELIFPHDKRSVKKWHNILQLYFSDRPDIIRLTTLLFGVGLAVPDMIKDIFQKAVWGKGCSKLQGLIQSFYTEFPKLLS